MIERTATSSRTALAYGATAFSGALAVMMVVHSWIF
jgi:hypothetical protein